MRTSSTRRSRDLADIDYLELASELGFKKMRLAGNQAYGRCLLHQDRNPSFSLNVMTGDWTCHTGCGPEHGRDFPMLVQLVLGTSSTEAERWVAKYRREPDNAELTKRIEALISGRPEEPAPTDYMGYYASLSHSLMPMAFLRRGFSWASIEGWGIRYDDVRDMVVIPVVDEKGEFKGTVSRYMNPPQGLGKYQNSPGLQKSHILFGLTPQGLGNAIILSEGPLDAIWLRQNGYPAVAVFGDSISSEQIGLLAKGGYSEVILAFDNPSIDQAAATALPKNKAKLYAAGWLMNQITMIQYPERAKDPNDCTSEQLEEAIQKRFTVL